MNKIEQVFQNQKCFIGFLTAGDPSLEKTVEYILTMEAAGVDLIEIGIPFSDPVAEGPVIERANERALKAGMNLVGVFEIVNRVRETSSIPLLFLTYLNPVYHYGYTNFFQKCKESKVDGIIIPDLPYEEKDEVQQIADEYDITLISLIAPTSKERIQQVVKEARGFVYAVSSLGVTGVRSEMGKELKDMVALIKTHTKTPCAVGFGIHTEEQGKNITKYADGIIVGSAIVKIIEEHKENASYHLREYIQKMKNSILENK